MDQRHDALLSASRFVGQVQLHRHRRCRACQALATIGWRQSRTRCAANVIPGKVRLGLEIRDLDVSKIKSLFDRTREAADEIGRSNGTTFPFHSRDISQPALTDKSLQLIIAATAKQLNFSTKLMPMARAGHDAQEHGQYYRTHR